MATKIKQLTRRRVPRRCSAHVAAIVLSPARPSTGTHRFVPEQMKLPLCVPTGCQTHCKHRSLSGTVSPSRSEKPLFSAYTGARGGRGLLLTHDHFYHHVSTWCFPRCFPSAVGGLPAPSNPTPPASRTLCSPPGSSWRPAPVSLLLQGLQGHSSPCQGHQEGYIWPTDTLGLVCTLLLKKKKKGFN